MDIKPKLKIIVIQQLFLTCPAHVLPVPLCGGAPPLVIKSMSRNCHKGWTHYFLLDAITRRPAHISDPQKLEFWTYAVWEGRVCWLVYDCIIRLFLLSLKIYFVSRYLRALGGRPFVGLYF